MEFVQYTGKANYKGTQMKTQPTAATAQGEPTEAMTELEAHIKEISSVELLSEARAEADQFVADNQKAKQHLGLARVPIEYKIGEDELEVIHKFANRETMLYLLLRVHQLDHKLPKVWEQDDIKKFCDQYCDEYGGPFLKRHQFADLIRKLEKKGILETDRQLSFEWAQ